MKKIIFFLLGLSSNLMFAQVEQSYFQGFKAALSGKTFNYPSAIPNETAAILLRGNKEYDALEWTTEAIPQDYDKDYISFVWMYGIDVTGSPVDFQLSVNGKQWFEFSSPKTSKLGKEIIEGENGSQLSFHTTLLDTFKDHKGFVVLKLPINAITKGESATIKIATTTTGTNSWLMTFKSEIEEKAEIYQNKVVAKKDGHLYHTISIDMVHMGKDTDVTVSVGNNSVSGNLKAGFNKLELFLPKVDSATEFSADIQVVGKPKSILQFTLKPVREWEIYMVQHTHTDIGYTRPQTEILPEHLRFIDHALDYCDQTDEYPDDAQFRWTIETSWSIREYLKSRPKEQILRLIRRLQEGRIEATGMFLNYSEIIDESALAKQTKTLKYLKDNGVDVTTAMQNDVNGIGWSMIDFFNNTDVKYLTMGVHAHRARKPFNKPTSFWWESPAGNRLMAYRSEHYQHGNTLGITSGQHEVLLNNISTYLSGLEGKNYPYNKVSLQFSGYRTDNSPPSTEACDIIREWNEKYEWPKLRSALASDFMRFLEKEHKDDLPALKVAWPDWWTDGVGSAANETKEVRKAHVDVAANTALLAMGRMLGLEAPENVQDDVQDVYDNLLFYDEHTHGAAESVTDPLGQNTINQWGMKASYAWEAAIKTHALEEKALAFLEPAMPVSNTPTIAIFNTLNWKRSGLVRLFLESEIVPEGAEFTITDSDGNEIPYQRYQQREEGAYFGLWVEDIPPMGFKTLQIKKGNASKPIPDYKDGNLENQFYKIQINTNKGVVSSLYDKQLQKELIDTNDTLSLGQFIYEQLDNRHEMERLTHASRDTVYKPIGLKRSILSNLKIIRRQNGAIYNSISLNGDMPICTDEGGVNLEIRLYHFEKKVEFLYSMVKLPITDPEGVYISFPFKLDEGQLAFEVQGGVVYPGVNQLEGSSSDWNTIQNFAAVKNGDSQIVFVSNEMPLVQFGAINTGRYYYRNRPKTNHIYSWVLNNYWVTNFKASQGGELQWTYSITSSNDNSDSFATQFGWGERVPLKSRIMLPSVTATSTKLTNRSLLDISDPKLLLVNSSLSLDNRSVILHIREIEGGHGILDIRRLLETSGASSAHEVNILEEELNELSRPLLFEHHETKFIKLNYE